MHICSTGRTSNGESRPEVRRRWGCWAWKHSAQALQSVTEMSSPPQKSTTPSFSIVRPWQSPARLHSTSFRVSLCIHVPNSLEEEQKLGVLFRGRGFSQWGWLLHSLSLSSGWYVNKTEFLINLTAFYIFIHFFFFPFQHLYSSPSVTIVSLLFFPFWVVFCDFPFM